MEIDPNLKVLVAVGLYDSPNSCSGNLEVVKRFPDLTPRFTNKCYLGGHQFQRMPGTQEFAKDSQAFITATMADDAAIAVTCRTAVLDADANPAPGSDLVLRTSPKAGHHPPRQVHGRLGCAPASRLFPPLATNAAVAALGGFVHSPTRRRGHGTSRRWPQ